MAQAAIEAAENGDFSEARMILAVLENPFSDKPLEEILSQFDQKGKIESSLENFGNYNSIRSLFLSCRGKKSKQILRERSHFGQMR